VTYLDETYPKLKDKIISQDLRYNINEIFEETVRYHWEFPIQYFDTNCFRTLEYRDQIPEFAGMFQKKWRNAFVKRRGLKRMEYYQF
jgi:16S rRNA (adenine1518-N6/adenine1519-N6)-dimethyltransferase